MKKIFFVLLAVLSQFAYAQTVNVLLFKDKTLMSAYEADSVTFAIVPTPGDYIDMGFPSGTLWASCNMGASKPEEYGFYYAWGETYTKSSYTMDSYRYGMKINKYPWSAMTKYVTDSEYGTPDYKYTLEDNDDVAFVKTDGECHLPTPAQIDELVNPEYTQQARTSLNGVDGYIVFSKFNGNSLFFPLAGYRDTQLWDAGKHLTIWSNRVYYYCGSAITLTDSEGKLQKVYYMRELGCSVRPVKEK